MKFKFIIPFLLILASIFSLKYFPFKDNLVVVKVIDGDTIDLNDGRTIRYINIDTPEIEEGECFSQEAKEINEELVLNKRVRLEMDINEMDRFGRCLAYVYVQLNTPPRWPNGLLGGEGEKKEIFINQYLLEQGAGEFFLDTVNLKHQSALVKAAEKAHHDKKGLWSVCAPDPKTGCQIKGNLDRLDKRWYHLPDFRHYNQVKINLNHGDRWFCTEEEAINAGFQKARE